MVSNVENPKSTENKGQEEIISPLKPQQLHFGSTSCISLGEATQNLLLPTHLTPLPLPTQVPPTMMVNVLGAPRIHNIVHIPYFLGSPGSDTDTHIAKFEITC